MRPRHWPVFWQDSVWRPLLDATAASEATSRAAEEEAVRSMEAALRCVPPQRSSARRTRKQPPPAFGVVARGDGGSGSDDDDDEQERDEVAGDSGDEDEDEPTSRPPSVSEAWSTLRDCSAIVGMHPDYATESIVDFALAAGKPFAIVPCCVFAVDFPSRIDPSTRRRVTSHASFVRYLAAKAPGRIGIASLPFAGKNTVLYSLPEGRAEEVVSQ